MGCGEESASSDDEIVELDEGCRRGRSMADPMRRLGLDFCALCAVLRRRDGSNLSALRRRSGALRRRHLGPFFALDPPPTGPSAAARWAPALAAAILDRIHVERVCAELRQRGG